MQVYFCFLLAVYAVAVCVFPAHGILRLPAISVDASSNPAHATPFALLCCLMPN